jgi:hypothetical protein
VCGEEYLSLLVGLQLTFDPGNLHRSNPATPVLPQQIKSLGEPDGAIAKRSAVRFL